MCGQSHAQREDGARLSLLNRVQKPLAQGLVVGHPSSSSFLISPWLCVGCVVARAREKLVLLVPIYAESAPLLGHTI